MASVVRTVGRHFPGLGTKQGGKQKGTARDGDGQKSPASPSSPFSIRQRSASVSHSSPTLSPLSHGKAALGAICTSSGSLSESSASQVASAGSNSSSADCLLQQRPLSDSSLSLAPSTTGDLNAASMDLSKLINGVERFQKAISKLREQFSSGVQHALATGTGGHAVLAFPDISSNFTLDASRTESDSSHFEERSIDDAISAARRPPPSQPAPAVTSSVNKPPQTPDSSDRSRAVTPASAASPSTLNSSLSDWRHSPFSDNNRLRSSSSTGQNWTGSDNDDDTLWMSTTPDSAGGEELRNQPNSEFVQSLREVLACIEAMLHEHIAMNGTELFLVTRSLYEQCIEHERLNPGEAPDFPEAVDSVSSAFTTCVSDYAFGDSASPDEDLQQLQESLIALSHTVESMESANRLEEEVSASAAMGTLAPGIPRHFLSEEVPKMLRHWSRYTKELSTYYQKRTQLEIEQAQKLIKLARSAADNLGELDNLGLPCFPSVQACLTEDVTFGRHCIENYSLDMSLSVIQPLKQLTEALDRVRHDLQAQWQKECRKAEKRKMEALGTMYKARQQYITACEEEHRQQPSQSNSSINVIWSKVDTAEVSYKQAVVAANEAQEQLMSLHESAFNHIAESAADAGTTCTDCINASHSSAKSLWAHRTIGKVSQQSTPAAGQAPHTLAADLISTLRNMVTNVEIYEFEDVSDSALERFSEPVQKPRRPSRTASVEELEENGTALAGGPLSPKSAWAVGQETAPDSLSSAVASPASQVPSSKRRNMPYTKSLLGNEAQDSHRTDGISFSRDSYSLEKPKPRKTSESVYFGTPETHRRGNTAGLDTASPILLSPAAGKGEHGTPSLSRRIRANLTADPASVQNTPASVRKLLAPEAEKPAVKSSIFPSTVLSSMAQMHEFQRLHGPAKCCHCESYVYFNGAECKQCGIACHRKCLQRLSAECFIPQQDQQKPPTKLQRAMSTFGINMAKIVTRSSQDVPAIVPACIKEVEERGLYTMGIYRLSGVKSKVEKLCQQFEKDGGKADVKLSSYSPHLIACVLKLFFRQLPEPLFTYKCYRELIQIGQEGYMGDNTSDELRKRRQHTVEKYRKLLASLPAQNFYTAKMLIMHLQKVAQNSAENNMTAGNLGIVFGPTLLTPKVKQGEPSTTVRSLVDMPHQSKAVELLILGGSEIFTPDLEPAVLKTVESAEYLGSSVSLNGSVDDLLEAGQADTREGMIGELNNMCNLLDAVKEQRDIGAATQQGADVTSPSTESTHIDGKLPNSTTLPGGIDLGAGEPSLTQAVKSQSTESGLGSIDESDLIQVVKKQQEERNHQAQLRLAMNHAPEGTDITQSNASDFTATAAQLKSEYRPTAVNLSRSYNYGNPRSNAHKRKGSLPSPATAKPISPMIRSTTQVTLTPSNVKQLEPEEFYRNSTEEVIRQRRRLRTEGKVKSPAASNSISHIASDMLMESDGLCDAFRLDVILDRQDTTFSESDALANSSIQLDRDQVNCYAVSPDLPSSEDDEDDADADELPESDPGPKIYGEDVKNELTAPPPSNGEATEVVDNPLLITSRDTKLISKPTPAHNEDTHDDRSISPLSFGDSDDDDASDVLSFLP